MILRPFLAMILGGTPASSSLAAGASQEWCTHLRAIASAAQSPDGLSTLGYSVPRPMFGFRECSVDEQLMGGIAFSCAEDFSNARRQWQSLADTVRACLPASVRQPPGPTRPGGMLIELRAGNASITIHLAGYANRREHYVSFIVENAASAEAGVREDR
jgi:hypothetical protein